MPGEWRSYRLGDLVTEHESGIYKHRDTYGAGTNIVGVSDLFKHDRIEGQAFRLARLTEREARDYQLQEGDLIYAESSLVLEGIAKTLHVAPGGSSTAFAWHTRRLKLNRKLAEPSYLAYCLGHHVCRRFVVTRATQTALTGIPVKAYFETPIQLPSLPEQRRIAEILDTLDEAIPKAEQVIKKLRQMKQGLLQDLLTRGISERGELRDPQRHPEQFKDSPLGRIPEEWEVRSLGTLAAWLSGGTPSKAIPTFWNGNIPWVSPKDMKQFRTGDAQDHVSEIGITAGSRLVPRDSILIVVRGMILAHTFPVCLTTREVAFNQDVKALVPVAGVSGVYLGHWFQGHTSAMLGLVTEATHGTKRIDLADIQGFRMALPPQDEQRRIAELLDEHDEQLRLESVERDKLRTLKQGLMDDLLTGRVSINFTKALA
jgi:type I restriction enzyme, S subunit